MYQNLLPGGHTSAPMYRQQMYEHDSSGLRSSPSWPALSSLAAADESAAAAAAAYPFASHHSSSSLQSRLGSIPVSVSASACSSIPATHSPNGVPNSPASASSSGCNVNRSAAESYFRGPTHDSYFRNVAAINGIHHYSAYAAEAAAGAAACTWASRLDAHSASTLSRIDPNSAMAGFPSMSQVQSLSSSLSSMASQAAVAAAAFRRAGTDHERQQHALLTQLPLITHYSLLTTHRQSTLTKELFSPSL